MNTTSPASRSSRPLLAVGLLGCSVPLLAVTASLLAECYVASTPVACCTPGSGESGCSAQGPSGPVYWNCDGSGNGPATVTTVTDAGTGEQGRVGYTSQIAGTCVQTSRVCGSKPNQCIATSGQPFDCVDVTLDPNAGSCTGTGDS